jgi:general secretion pathway protein D
VAGAPAAGAAAGAAGAAGAPGTPAGALAGGTDIVPAGQIKFQEAELSQVLEIYQDLTGRTILKPATLPAAKISIRTQTELTRAEAVQALDTILAMNGITMTLQGDKFIKALPEAQAQSAGAKFNEIPVDDLPETARYVTHVVQAHQRCA